MHALQFKHYEGRDQIQQEVDEEEGEEPWPDSLEVCREKFEANSNDTANHHCATFEEANLILFSLVVLF